MSPSVRRVDVEELQNKVAELERHAKALLVAERRAYEAKQSLGRQLDLLRKVNELSRILSAARGPSQILEQAVEFIVREFSYERGAVLMLDGALRTISVAAAAGGIDPEQPPFRIEDLRRAGSVLETALNEERPILVEGDLKPGDPIRAFGLDHFFVLPLGVERAIPIGLLLLGNTAGKGVYYRAVEEQDVALLSTIAGQMALMLDKAELYEHLQKEKEELERTQMELRSANEGLEERVREKTQALRVSMRKLEESRLQLEQYSWELEVQVEERTRRLRESEQIYRSVMANSRAGMAVYRNGLILEVNPALTEIVGEHLEGRALSTIVRRIADVDRRTELEKTLNDEESSAAHPEGNFEVRALRGEKERVWNISAFPLDSESRLYGLVVVDTTESRRVEQQLFGSQKMASLGNLAGGIAHEFNNILVGILGNASLLKTRVPRDGEIASLVNAVENSALRAADLVQQLLGFARKGKYRSERLDLNAIVRDTLDLARRSFGPRIEVRLDLSPDLLPVEGDATQIQQVIMNLALNAREAIGEAGRITARTCTRTLTADEASGIPGLAAGRWVEIEIRDNGRGIDQDTKRMIFEPFFSTKGSGATGLGLPMVYGIVTNHGGAVEVRSEPGAGTSVFVYFPAVERREGPLPAGGKRRSAGTGVVLVVDDEEILRRMCRDALQEFGYEVQVAKDGQEACEYCEAGHPVDLVLLDLAMPRKSGLETYGDLKRLRPGLKIVVCTGFDEKEIPEALTGDKIEGILSKPFTCQDLRTAVETALENCAHS